MQHPGPDPVAPRTDPLAIRVDRDIARPSRAAPALGLGGLLLAVSSFLTWATDESGGGEGESVQGYLVSDGRLVLGIGAALVLLAIYMGTTRRHGHWFDADLLGLALATIALSVMVSTWAAIPDEASPEIGLYVGVAGGLTAFVGTLIAIMTGHRDPGDVDRVTTRRTLRA